MLLIAPVISACSSAESGSSQAAIAAGDSQSSEAIKIGVLVVDNTNATRSRYQPLIDELSNTLGRPIELIPVTQKSQLPKVETGNVDFIFSNPLASAKIRQLHGSQILATVSRPETGTAFSGAIVVPPDSTVQSLEDLRGKKGACVSMKTAAAGCIFQIYHLKQQGIDPYRETIIEEINSQDEIVKSVVGGELDFGFIRMDQLQRMTDRGLISSPDVVRVLEPVEDDYAISRTTSTYPEWAISATQDAPASLVQQMQAALLQLPADNPAMAAAGIEKFVPAEDYSRLDALLAELNLTTDER